MTSSGCGHHEIGHTAHITLAVQCDATLTDTQLRDKDYIIKYDNYLYMIDYTNPANPLGNAQYLNCAMKSRLDRINNEKMIVVKITVPVVNVGQQLFTSYGRELIIPKRALRHSCPPSYYIRVFKCGGTCHTAHQYTNNVWHFRGWTITAYRPFIAETLLILHS